MVQRPHPECNSQDDCRKPFVAYLQKDEEKDQWQSTVGVLIDFLGKFSVFDSLPFLRWLVIEGQEKAMKKVSRELDIVVEGWLDLEEYKKKRAIGNKKRRGRLHGRDAINSRQGRVSYRN